jgi:biotin operon repressor
MHFQDAGFEVEVIPNQGRALAKLLTTERVRRIERLNLLRCQCQ